MSEPTPIKVDFDFNWPTIFTGIPANTEAPFNTYIVYTRKWFTTVNGTQVWKREWVPGYYDMHSMVWRYSTTHEAIEHVHCWMPYPPHISDIELIADL